MSAKKPRNQRSPRRETTGGLCADDFQRLGLQLSEARVSVIRKATQAATSQWMKATAKRASDEESEAEIARVVTSAYRLLDPRRRKVVAERIQLLRATPKPIRTSLLQGGNQPLGLQPPETGLESEMSHGATANMEAALVEDESADEQWMLEMLADLRTEPMRGSALERRRTDRHHGLYDVCRRWGRRHWVSGLGVCSIGLLAILVILVQQGGESLGMRSPQDESVPQSPFANIPEEPDPTSQVPQDSQAPQESQSQSTTAETSVDQGGGLTTLLQPGGVQHARKGFPGSSQGDGRPRGDTLSDLQQRADGMKSSDLAGVPLALPQGEFAHGALEIHGALETRGALETSVPAETSAPTETLEGTLVPNHASSTPLRPQGVSGQTEMTKESSAGSPGDLSGSGEVNEGMIGANLESEQELAIGVPGEQPAPTLSPIRFPLPDQAACEEARRNLARDYPALTRLAQKDLEVLRSLWQQAERFPAGSAAQFVFLQAVVEQSILLGFRETAASLRVKMMDRYAVAPTRLDSLLLRGLVDSAATITEQERVASWALMAMDRALLAEDFEGGEEIGLVGTRLASQLGDESLRSRYRQRREQFVATQRIAPRARELIRTRKPDEVTGDEAAIVARYLCLDRREWTEGLPWMVRGRDARLAALARDELTFGASSDAKTIVKLADRWLELSEGGRRVGSDAMRLHGRDLLAIAAERADGVEQLEIRKRLVSLVESLPADLKPLVIFEEPFTPSGQASSTLPLPGREDDILAERPMESEIVGNAIADPQSLGMLGRLVVAGQDTGLVLQYPTHLPLRGSSLEPLLRQRGFEGIQQIEFHGVLEVTQRTTVSLRLDGVGPKTQLSVNGQLISMQGDAENPLKANARIDLNAGRHRFVWQTIGNPLATQRLVLRDDRNGAPLQLRHDEISRQIVERLPVISRIQIRSQ